jgi:acyl-homoserine lactone acylase PvdQ
MNGTSWRHLIDMGDVEHAKVMIDGSISGQWLSPHYDDLVRVWHRGEFITATMDPEAVEQEAAYHLVLKP